MTMAERATVQYGGHVQNVRVLADTDGATALYQYGELGAQVQYADGSNILVDASGRLMPGMQD